MQENFNEKNWFENPILKFLKDLKIDAMEFFADRQYLCFSNFVSFFHFLLFYLNLHKFT